MVQDRGVGGEPLVVVLHRLDLLAVVVVVEIVVRRELLVRLEITLGLLFIVIIFNTFGAAHILLRAAHARPQEGLGFVHF